MYRGRVDPAEQGKRVVTAAAAGPGVMVVVLVVSREWNIPEHRRFHHGP
jgi:hypothetical protein